MEWDDETNIRSRDLSAGVAIAIGAVGVTLVQVPEAVSVAVILPVLLFVPGYATTVALFPRELPIGIRHNRVGTRLPVALDRVVLSVATSVALSVIVGVTLDFTLWSIRLQTIIGSLAAVTVAGTIIGLVRRKRRLESEQWRPQLPERQFSGSQHRQSSNTLTVANVAVTAAVLVAAASVATTAAIDQRGERYTEFGLLTPAPSGELTADDHPSNLTFESSSTWYYMLANKEQQTTDYTVVVQLVSADADGDSIRQVQLDTFSHRLRPGETTRNRHTVTPTIRGEDLQLRYLLYRSDPPTRPRASNAYRDLHVWVDVVGE
jgi:uncharacterized membrane protein